MDRLPTEILRRIPVLLPTSDVSRLMRAGCRRLYLVCGEHLYASILLSVSLTTSHNPPNAPRVHGRSMLQVLSDDAPRGYLQHPARWIRHLAVSWPRFPTGEDAQCCSLLLLALARTESLMSLELRGPSPLAWRDGLDASVHPPHFLSRLVALKTDDIQDSVYLSENRRLESIFITTPSTFAELTALLDSAGPRPASMKQLQLSLELASIEEVTSAFQSIIATFRDLSVLCVEFDLGINFPERPLAWATMNNALAKMGLALGALHHLQTISVTMFPEPFVNVDENKKAIELLGAHCVTLQQIEVRWHRKDGNEYRSASMRDGLIRGQWAYKPSLG